MVILCYKENKKFINQVLQQEFENGGDKECMDEKLQNIKKAFDKAMKNDNKNLESALKNLDIKSAINFKDKENNSK